MIDKPVEGPCVILSCKCGGRSIYVLKDQYTPLEVQSEACPLCLPNGKDIKNHDYKN